MAFSFSCQFCEKSFSFRSGLSRHINKKHSDDKENNGKMTCGQCDARFLTISDLIVHLKDEHNMQTCTKNIAFESINQFKEWKLQEERKSKAHFVRNSSIKEYGSVKYMYYYCNRSGHYKWKGNGERSPQSQRTCRSGNTCIAYMKTMEDTLSKSVVVEYCSTHTGHEIKVKHLPILQDIKLKIAQKLQDGVSINRILDDIKDNCLDGGVGREQLVTRQDILNIKRKLNLHTIQKHSNDLLSVCSWVEEMKQLEYNPILAFKTQGEDGNEDVCHLKREDFFLSIQTEFQKDALLKFDDACNTMISKCNNSQTCHQAMKALTQEIIENTTECYDLDTLHAVKKHLNSALLVLKLGINKELPAFNPTSNPAPNKNHEKQPRFFSTKRKRPSKARMPKPSYEDQETALNKLEQTEVIVCNYCWKEEDDGNNSEICWINCSKCGVWIHTSCCQSTSSTLEDFFCKHC